MRPKRTLAAALSLAALFFACERAALACSCVPPGAPRDEAARARAVFVGEVVEVAPAGEAAKKSGGKCAQETGWHLAVPNEGGVRVRFKVSRVWKNVAGGEVVIKTPASSAACGYAFRKGESYVVYAYGGDDALGQLTTGLCSRTRPVSAAEEDLRDLGAGEPPSASAVASPAATVKTTAKPAASKTRRTHRRRVRRRT